ncbi:MAG: tetratricopeptide repeat protein [Planctomycetes bacterium]|nr:tetratricopeptide repeat protein [Planctomycetota bacterium]
MRVKRWVLCLAVACLVLAAGCGQTHFDKQREEARARWTESRGKMAARLAQGCYDRGEFDLARRHVEEILKFGEPYAPIYVLAARLAIEKGELDDARAYAEHAKAIDPKDPEACYVLGTVEQTLGHNETALAEFAEAASLRPNEARYSLAESEMLVAAGRADGAAIRLRDAIERMPGQVELRTALGDVLSLLGQYGEAAGCYRMALRLGSDPHAMRERLAVALFRSGAYAEAAPMLAELATSYPDAGPDWLFQMRVDGLLARDWAGEARLLCQRRAEAHPAASVPQVALAKCDILEDQLPSARKYLEAALAFDPSDAEASALMGYVLVIQGRSREALPYLRSAMKDPKCAGRRTVRQLLARAEGRPVDEPEDAAPLPGKPQAAGDGESPYTVAKPVRPS